jgi:hypothetical protein
MLWRRSLLSLSKREFEQWEFQNLKIKTVLVGSSSHFASLVVGESKVSRESKCHARIKNKNYLVFY